MSDDFFPEKHERDLKQEIKKLQEEIERLKKAIDQLKHERRYIRTNSGPF